MNIRENQIWYRNPKSGEWEPKEFGERVSAPRFVRTAGGGYAADATGHNAVEFADATLGILRIADPVQTGLAQGFKMAEAIGDKLLVPVRMEKETGRFPAFGKEAFYIPANLKRGIGEKVQRLQSQSGYVLQSLSEYSLGVGIENRERNEWAGSPDLLITSKLGQVTDKVARMRELLQATLLTTYTNYASGNYASGAAFAWATSGDPIAKVRQLILQVLQTTGQRPDVFWATPTNWELIINNAAVKKTLKGLVNFGSLEGGMITPAMFAAAIQVKEVLVGYANYAVDTSSLPTDGGVKKSEPSFGYIWEKVNSSACGVLIRGTGGGIEPAFGYTWERKNSPIVESYYDNRTKQQVWDYEHFFDPAITLNNAGAMYYSVA